MELRFVENVVICGFKNRRSFVWQS